MASGQRITGDYLLEAVPLQTGDVTTINFKSDHTEIHGTTQMHSNVYIQGDLTVDGVTTTVNSVELTITDNVITLAKGTVDSGVALASAGIEVDRGNGNFTPSMYWDELLQSWILFDGVNNNYIVNNSSGGIGLTAVVDDLTPELGGNLDANNKSIYSSTNEIKLDNPLTLPPTYPSAYPTVPGSVSLFNSGASGFDSGLSYANSSGGTGELISKAQALVFALIF